jgi:hypothetical protein
VQHVEGQRALSFGSWEPVAPIVPGRVSLEVARA